MSETLTIRGYHFTPEQEEIYFSVTLTLPRVGEQTFQFVADRYMAKHWGENGEGPAVDRLTNWRTILQNYGDEIPGVGEKARDTVRAVADRLFTQWVADGGHFNLWPDAVTQYIVREICEKRYGGFDYAAVRGREALESYGNEISGTNLGRITEALTHMEKAQELLNLAKEDTDNA